MPTIDDNVRRLRALMREKGVDACLVGTADPHNSEYLAPYYKARAWLSGFTGSAGTAVVTADRALLWADGRYYIQAEKELAGTPFQLMKQGAPGVPSHWTWLAEHLKDGQAVAADGRLLPEADARDQEERLGARGISLVTDLDLVGPLWEDRPPLPSGKIFHHDLRYTGRRARDKIGDVRAKMAEDKADYALYVGLDDIAWLMNFRGSDVPNNAVAMAFALISRNRALLFIDPVKVDGAMQDLFAGEGIELRPYDALIQELGKLAEGVLVTNTRRTGRALIKALPEEVKVLDRQDYPYELKARLNEVERQSQLRAGLRDSLAVTRYLYFIKRQAVKEGLNEYQAAKRLADLRRQSEAFIIESFPSISAYGPNAAMMHYQATAEKCSPLAGRSFYLIDCGAQSFDGTTDITRTVSLGPLTEEERRDYTMTLKSHIALASQPFLKGTCGVALDAIARSTMWRYGLDYKCGTGHGFGFVLGVHEGPQRLSNNPVAGRYAFAEHMVITIEPGVYREGRHGIRLENDYLVLPVNQTIAVHEGKADFEEKEVTLNDDGDCFLHFQSLTYVPFDRAAILPDLLSPDELNWLNDYHQAVRQALAPHLSGDERTFLLEETEAL